MCNICKVILALLKQSTMYNIQRALSPPGGAGDDGRTAAGAGDGPDPRHCGIRQRLSAPRRHQHV